MVFPPRWHKRRQRERRGRKMQPSRWTLLVAVGCLASVAGGRASDDGEENGAEESAGCVLTAESVQLLSDWYEGKISGDEVAITCAARAAGKVAGQVLGAGAGLAAGSQLGKGLGKGLADLLNMNEDEAGGLGEMLLGAAGAYIGSELGGAVGEEIAGELAKQFFQTGGFDSPTGALAECHQLMGIDESTNAAAAKKAYRKKSMQLHPDKPGGSEEAMTKLNICKELVLIDCQHKRQGRGGHSSPSPPKSERSDDAAEEAEEAEEAPPASGKAVAAPPSAADLAGFYCGDKEVDLLLTSAEARLVLKIDPESDTAGVFAFKVSGDVTVPWCKKNRYVLSEGGELKLDPVAEVARCGAKLLTKYGVEWDGESVRGKTFFGKFAITPQVLLLGQVTDGTLSVGVDGVPLLGEITMEVTKSNCAGKSSPGKKSGGRSEL